MRVLFFISLFTLISSLSVAGQEVAAYYFYNNFQEFAQSFPELTVTGRQGEFLTEVVPKLGNTPRQVYSFPRSSGLVFDYSKIDNFIVGSYAVEMYFRYDNADLLMYGMIIGERSVAREGEFIHLVTTRDAESKRVNVFLDGELTNSFIDAENQLDIVDNAQFIFFTRKDTETTSGAVALVKIYNYFIDEEKAAVLFEPFLIDEGLDRPNSVQTKSVLKRLYFVQSLPKLLPESLPAMESLRDFMLANPQLSILLTGHTDNQGDFHLNLKLSRERAESVKDYLIESGVEEKRIQTKGYGNLRPVASNATENTRRLNRRVELEIVK